MITMKPVCWLGSAKELLRGFPDDVKREIGHELRNIQSGLDPSDWRAMQTVGTGVRELRVHLRGEYRLMYITNHPEAVYVLHVFAKTSRKTLQHDVALARKRLRDLIHEKSRFS